MGSFELRDWEKAEAEARARLLSSGADADRVALIEALAASGQFDAVIAEHAGLNAPTPRSLATLGRSLIEAGRIDEGVAACAACLQSNRDDPEDWLAAARVFELAGRAQEALACAQRALVLSPHSPSALSMVGLCLLGVDDELARRRLEASVRLEPAQPRAWLALSRLDGHQGRWNEAKGSARRALELASQWTEAQAWFHHVALRTRPIKSYFILVPMVASSAIALSAFSRIGGEGFWPRIALSMVIFVAALCLDVVRQRRRSRQLEALGTPEARLEAKLGVGSATQALPPSLARASRFIARGLRWVAWFFAVWPPVLAWLVVRYSPPGTLHFHPGMLVILIPWALTAMLWWEARQMDRRVAQAERDRT